MSRIMVAIYLKILHTNTFITDIQELNLINLLYFKV